MKHQYNKLLEWTFVYVLFFFLFTFLFFECFCFQQTSQNEDLMESECNTVYWIRLYSVIRIYVKNFYGAIRKCNKNSLPLYWQYFALVLLHTILSMHSYIHSSFWIRVIQKIEFCSISTCVSFGVSDSVKTLDGCDNQDKRHAELSMAVFDLHNRNKRFKRNLQICEIHKLYQFTTFDIHK